MLHSPFADILLQQVQVRSPLVSNNLPAGETANWNDLHIVIAHFNKLLLVQLEACRPTMVAEAEKRMFGPVWKDCR